MDLLSLTPEQFESLTFDLVSAIGLKNVVWRTPGSDGGRDIEGVYYISDLSGHYQKQKWYVECKRYTGSVDWPTVWKKAAYAESNNADMLLVVTSSSLTPQAVDNVNQWNENGKKPTIRFWGGVEITTRLNLHPQISSKYGLTIDRSSHLFMFNSIIELLIKTAHSVDIDSTNISSDKILLIHTLSELISSRVSDIESHGTFFFKPHKELDKFHWFDYKGSTEISLDKYSTRAALAYLKLLSKGNITSEDVSKSNITVTINRELNTSEITHLKTISEFSNFSLYFNGKSICLEKGDV